jgi:hypothetical protein
LTTIANDSHASRRGSGTVHEPLHRLEILRRDERFVRDQSVDPTTAVE